MTLTYISCSSAFYTFYVNAPLSLGCMIQKVSAKDIAIRGNGTGLEYMCPTRHFVYIFFNPVFQVSTAKNEINLFNNHFLIVAPVTFAPAGAMTPSAEFLLFDNFHFLVVKFSVYLNRLVFITKSIILSVDVPELCWMDGKQCRPDQMLHFVGSDVHSPVCLGLSAYSREIQYMDFLYQQSLSDDVQAGLGLHY